MIPDFSNLKDPARRTKNDGGRASRDPRTGGVTSCSPSATQVYRQLDGLVASLEQIVFICSCRSLLNYKLANSMTNQALIDGIANSSNPVCPYN